jgi:hypothetical protein
MTIDTDTIRKLLDLVEDNKDTFNEFEYIQSCNALKELYTRSKTEFIDIPESVLELIYGLQNKEASMISKIQKLEDELQQPVPAIPVTNKDRQQLIELLWPETIRRGPRGGVVKMTVTEIKTCISYIAMTTPIDEVAFEKIVLEKLYQEHNRHMRNTLNKLKEAHSELRSWRNRLAWFQDNFNQVHLL